MEWPIAAGGGEAYPTQKEDGHDLVGIVALADVAKALPDKPVGEVLEAISA